MNHHAFDLLGRLVKDAVTGMTGIVESVCFDLYGYVQAAIRRQGLDEKFEPKPSHWYDVKRLFVLEAAPVMPVPDFSNPEIGSADKPSS